MPMKFLERRLSPGWFQFLKFSMVGTVAFSTDVIVLYLSFMAGFGLYSGRVVSYLVAISAQWALNRRFTFAYQGQARAHVQWAKSVVYMSIGTAINYGIYALLVMSFDFVADYPFIGVAFGSVAALAVNYPLSRKFVFSD